MEVQERSTNLWYSAEYWSFKIGDELNDKYRLQVSGYSGDAGDSLQYEGEWLGNGRYGVYYHNGMKFSTHDQDNDLSIEHCAYVRQGGWWYNHCYYSSLMCKAGAYEWDSLPTYYIVNSRMMIKQQWKLQETQLSQRGRATLHVVEILLNHSSSLNIVRNYIVLLLWRRAFNMQPRGLPCLLGLLGLLGY